MSEVDFCKMTSYSQQIASFRQHSSTTAAVTRIETRHQYVGIRYFGSPFWDVQDDPIKPPLPTSMHSTM